VQFAQACAHQFRTFPPLLLFLESPAAEISDARFASSMIRAIIPTASTGYFSRCGFPPKASPHRSHRRSVATSEASARSAAVLRHGFSTACVITGRRISLLANNRFLNHGHALRIHLHAQIAARHIHAVGARQNPSRFLSLRLLQLGDHRSVFPPLPNQLFPAARLSGRRTNSRQCSPPMFESEGQSARSFGVSRARASFTPGD